MSYDISFKVKYEGLNQYVCVGDCYANTTYNVREMIVKSTGLDWVNCGNNGYCKDIIPKIEKGLNELKNNPEKYRKYEAKNGWGTVGSTACFFKDIIRAWNDLKKWEDKELVDVTTFWIEQVKNEKRNSN